MTPAPTHRLHPVPALVALVCALLLSGCGDGAKTGSGVDTHVTGPAKTCGILGCEATPTAKPTTKPTATRRTTAPVVTRTTARPTTKPTAVAKPFDIYIYGDKSGRNLIDPPQAAVYAGTTVIWHNADTVAHGVQAQDGAFTSGDIRPGGTFTWVAKVVGNHPYQDTKRPYVNAAIQVAPR